MDICAAGGTVSTDRARGQIKRWSTLLFAPLIHQTAPESVEEMTQLALLLHKKATMAVPSSMNCTPWKVICKLHKLLNVPSGAL